MPVSRKEVKKIEDEKLKTIEFLKEKKDSEEPYYSAGEMINELRLQFSIDEVENYLFGFCFGHPAYFEKVKIKGIYFYRAL